MGATDQKLEGILLYPTVDASLDLRYTIHGHAFRVVTIDMNSSWHAIKDNLLCMISEC
jgi:hypothetical protein